MQHGGAQRGNRQGPKQTCPPRRRTPTLCACWRGCARSAATRPAGRPCSAGRRWRAPPWTPRARATSTRCPRRPAPRSACNRSAMRSLCLGAAAARALARHACGCPARAPYPTLLYTLYHAAAGWGPGADGAGRAGLHRRRRAAPLQRLPAARLLPRAPTAQRDRRRCAARDGLPRQGGRPPATFRLRDMLARERPACVIDLTRGDWPFSSSRLVPTQDWCEAHPVPPWHAPLRGQAGKKSRRGAERPAQHASGSGCGRARRQPSSQQRGGRRGARDSRAPAPT